MPLRSETLQKIWLELIWWVITGLVTTVILLPILKNTIDYPFLKINVFFIITLLTFFRYVFFLRFTFLKRLRWAKFILVFISIPLIFMLVNYLNHFLTHLDENSFDSFLIGRADPHLAGYIKSEMLLFGVGSVIISVILPFRMILSLWRQHNRGTA